MKTKTEVMEAVASGVAHECFEHSECGWFDVTLMREWAKANVEPTEVEIGPLAEFLADNRVWEPARVDDITDEQADDPGLAVQYAEDVLFIDGTHRCFARIERGYDTMMVYIVPESVIIRPAPTMGVREDHDWGDGTIEKDGTIKRR